MTNKDKVRAEKLELQTKICQAIKDGDFETAVKLFEQRDEMIVSSIMSEFADYKKSMDEKILEKAGVMQFTSAELKAFDGIKMLKKSADSGVDIPFKDLPATFIDRIFIDAPKDSELLSVCDVTVTGMLKTMLIDGSEAEPATLVGMGEEIPETSGKIESISLLTTKLAKIIRVPNEILDVGPNWIARFVYKHLKEVLILGAETAIVSADGKNDVIGMLYDRSKGTNEDGSYKKKTAIALTTLKPQEYDETVEKLTIDSKNKYRAVKEVVLIVHPSTYMKKILPATTQQNPNGTYNINMFPYPTKVIQSTALEKDEALLGLPNKYQLFIGTGTSKDGKIVEDASVAFKTHCTLFKIFVYIAGLATDDNDFILLDVSNLKVEVPKLVQVVDVVTTTSGDEKA